MDGQPLANVENRPQGRLGMPRRVAKEASPVETPADVKFDPKAFQAATAAAAAAGPETRTRSASARATGSEGLGGRSTVSTARTTRSASTTFRHNPMQRPPSSARSGTGSSSGGSSVGRVPSYLQPTASSSTRKEIAPLGSKRAAPPAITAPTVYELGAAGVGGNAAAADGGGAASSSAAAAVDSSGAASPPQTAAAANAKIAVSPLLMLPTPALHGRSAQATTRSDAERAFTARGTAEPLAAFTERASSEAVTAAAFAGSAADACELLAANAAKLARQASSDRMALQAANSALSARTGPAEGVLIELADAEPATDADMPSASQPDASESADDKMGISQPAAAPLAAAPAPSDVDLLSAVDLSAVGSGMDSSASVAASRPAQVPAIAPPATAPPNTFSPGVTGRGEGKQLLDDALGAVFTYPAVPKSPLIRFTPALAERSSRLSRSPKRSAAGRSVAPGSYAERSPGRFNDSGRSLPAGGATAAAATAAAGAASAAGAAAVGIPAAAVAGAPTASGGQGADSFASPGGAPAQDADRKVEGRSSKRLKRVHSTPGFSVASCDLGSPLVPLDSRGFTEGLQSMAISDLEAVASKAGLAEPAAAAPPQPPPLTLQSSAPAAMQGTPGRSVPASRRPPAAPPAAVVPPAAAAIDVTDRATVAPSADPEPAVAAAAVESAPAVEPDAPPPAAPKLRGDDRPLKRPEAFKMPSEWGPEAYPPGAFPPEAYPPESGATTAASAGEAKQPEPPKKLRGDDRPLKRPTGEGWKIPDELPPEAFAPTDGSRGSAWGEKPKSSPRQPGSGSGAGTARSGGATARSGGSSARGPSRLAALATTSGMAAAAAPVAAPTPRTKPALLAALSEACALLKTYEADWERRCAALNSLPPMLARGVELGDGAFDALLEILVHSQVLGKQCEELRSAVVRCASQALQEIAKEHGRAVAPLTASTLPSLFKGLSNAKLPISSACKDAGLALVTASPTSSTLATILASAVDKHHQCRRGVAEYLTAVLHATGTIAGEATARGTFSSQQVDAMLKAMCKLTSDSNGPVREAAAKGFWVLHAKWPEPAEAAMSKMDPAQHKLLKRLKPAA